MPEERMSEEDFNDISVKCNALSLYAVLCLLTEAKRARARELHLENQLHILFRFLGNNYPEETFAEDSKGACSTTVKVIEKLKKENAELKRRLNDNP